MKDVVNIGLIQMTCSDNIEENFKKAVDYARRAANQGAKIVCFQELFKSRYFPQVADEKLFGLAERIDENSGTLRALRKLAGGLEIALVASLFEDRAPGLYHNTAIVIDADGSYLGKYRKMHIPDDPFYYEKYYFTPGDLGYRVFKTRYAHIGVLICWDQWFPEAARLTAMKGAEIIFIPTAIGYMPHEKEKHGTSTRDAWQVVQRGHAVANGCFLAAVNRVGFEENPEGKGGLNFWGQSFVAGPYGNIVKEGSEDTEEILLCSVDLSALEETRRSLSHFFRDRRVDSYNGLAELFLDSES